MPLSTEPSVERRGERLRLAVIVAAMTKVRPPRRFEVRLGVVCPTNGKFVELDAPRLNELGNDVTSCSVKPPEFSRSNRKHAGSYNDYAPACSLTHVG